MTSPDDWSQPDARLGHLLRHHLDAPDHVGFANRVRAALERRDSSWDVLNRWARPGLAAALAAGFALGIWLGVGTPSEPDPSIADAVRPADAPAQLFGGAEPPGATVVLAGLVEDR